MPRTAASLLLLLALLSPAIAGGHHRHAPPAKSAPAKAAPSVQVWVNLDSGIYHYPGERWYGRTKNGQYMSEEAAIKAGYRATENGQ